MPTKAAYERFEASPDMEFDFLLARKLGWRSVAEMRAGMSNREWLEWGIYLARQAQQRQMAMGQGSEP